MLYVLLGFRLIAFTVFDFFTTYYIVFQDHAQDKYWPRFDNFSKFRSTTYFQYGYQVLDSIHGKKGHSDSKR